MPLNTEIITRLFWALVAMFIAYKFLGPALHMLLDKILGNNKKTRNSDFDYLVESQKQALRSQYGLSGGAKQGTRNKKKSNVNLSELYSAAYMKEKGDEKRKNSLKKVMQLIDSLQWGEGEIISDVQSYWMNYFNYDIPSQAIVSVTKKIVSEDIFSQEKKLPGFGVWLEIICARLLLEQLAKECPKRDGTFLRNLEEELNIGPKPLSLAAECMLLKASGLSDNQLYIVTLEGPHPNSSTLQDAIPGLFQSPSLFPKIKELLKILQEYALLFANLEPFPPLKNGNDLKGAYRVLGLDEHSSFDEAKKVYRKWVFAKHPDRLQGKKLPNKYLKNATENFNTLQKAFDIIKKNNN